MQRRITNEPKHLYKYYSAYTEWENLHLLIFIIHLTSIGKVEAM